MLIAGVVFLSLACRTLKGRFFRRIGAVGVLAASYLAGWLLSGRWEVGLGFVAAWFLLPWFEILTRIRNLRLPIKRCLEQQPPPPRQVFPDLPQLTAEVEAVGVEHMLDAGWVFQGHRHFFRLFYNSERRCDASISFVEQEEFAFFYLSLCSRCQDGRTFISWNYPFSYSLKMPPHLIINRIPEELSPESLYAAHLQFLAAHDVHTEMLQEQTSETLLSNIRQEMQDQVVLNLKNGLLQRDGDSFFRYSPRGMFFLWIQFLRDMVKFS